MARGSKRADAIMAALNADKAHRYSVAALARASGCQREGLTQAIQPLLDSRKVKQTEFLHGRRFAYAYSANDVPDDAPILVAKTQVVITTYIPI